MSDKKKKVKVKVDEQTAFLLGASLGKEKAIELALDWAKDNPYEIARAWAERNEEESKAAWLEGGESLQQKLKVWVEANPDVIVSVWIEKKSKTADYSKQARKKEHHKVWYDIKGKKNVVWYETGGE
jgi:hypothetical protein